MKDEIIKNIDNLGELESLYRKNSSEFKKGFAAAFPDINDNIVAKVWNERLNNQKSEINWGAKNELLFIIISSILAGVIAKFPKIFNLVEEHFYPRNWCFIIFPFLVLYFSWKKNIEFKKYFIVFVPLLISIIFINWLPQKNSSDTLILSCIHLPLFIWTILGFSFIGYNSKNYQERIEYLRFNGDLAILSIIILLTGVILTVITLILFSLINLSIEEFYFEYIVIWGISATPIVATYLLQVNSQLVNKVTPIIAKVFTPLILITLVVYIIAMIYTGKNPYKDREFLIAFNALLIGVISIIFFSIVETTKGEANQFTKVILTALAIVTIVVNVIALSAIIFRISEWGITPNRISVLIGNILILVNLILITYHLIITIVRRQDLKIVENIIAKYLPIYTLWTIIVCFIFPFIFNFK